MKETVLRTSSIAEVGTETSGPWSFIIKESIGYRGYFLHLEIRDRFEQKVWFLGSEEKRNRGSDECEITVHVDGSEADLEFVRTQLADAVESNWLALQMIRIMSRINRDDYQEGFQMLGNLRLPFGKYIGIQLRDVPLSYLDQTISEMPQTWLVRQVMKFVDGAMDEFALGGWGIGGTSNIPTKSYEELRQR